MADAGAQTASFAGTAESLAPARDFLRRYLTDAGWPGSDLDAVIALGEIIQNVVRHGFHGGRTEGTITITVEILNDRLVVLVEDNAPPSLPLGWSGAGRRPHEGGLGLGIARRIASKIDFQPVENGNRALLKFLPK